MGVAALSSVVRNRLDSDLIKYSVAMATMATLF